MSLITRARIPSGLKETLDAIVDDDTDGAESRSQINDWLSMRPMEDAYEDDVEYAGPSLLSEKPEGQDIQMQSIQEGYTKRYIARTYAGRFAVTREAMEDNKYDQILVLQKRLKKAMWQTVAVDSCNILARAETAGYVGGDSVVLASASHTLAWGGTFSNKMATPMSPSRAAVIVATSQIRTFPGHDGLRHGYNPETVVFPVEQWAVWEGLLGSDKAPEAGQFNEINVVSTARLGLKPVKGGLVQWSNTTANWAIITDADNGLCWRWRVKPSPDSWVGHENSSMNHGIRARWDRGWSDARGVLFNGS